MFQCHRDEHERNERDSEQQIKKRAQLRHVKCFPMEYRDMLHMRETKQSECQCGKQKHPFHHRHGRQGFFFRHEEGRKPKQSLYLQPIITQYFIDNKSEIWLLFLIAHSKR